MAFDIPRHWQKINHLLGRQEPFVVVTLVDMRGSAPQVVGAKAIVTAAGIVEGTVGGGKVEARAVSHALDLLTSNNGQTCQLVTWNLQTEIGMTCGGEVKFYFEAYLCNDWRIAVFGAGHVAQALLNILLPMHCRITCVDPREEWLAKIPDHPKLTKRQHPEPQELVADLDPATFCVLVTQGHATDLPILARILTSRDAPYVGVLGSLQKAKVLQRDLRSMGIPEDRLGAYYCPMGLPLGNNTPPEIAVSIAAQLVQRRDELCVIDHKTKKF